MARIIKKSDHLHKKYRHCILLCVVGFVCAASGFITFAVGMYSLGIAVFPPCAAILLGGTVFGGYWSSKAVACKRGIEGEEITAGIVSSLPEGYVGIQNLIISYQGKSSEPDMVVVGTTGVFIIETKNMGGTIYGNYDSPMWTQKKVGSQGTPYSKNFHSPIRQVNTHTFRLANLLRSNGFSVYVRDMVFFANPETVLQLIGQAPKTPVFSASMNSPTELTDCIRAGDRVLTDAECAGIVAFLDAQSN